MPGSMDGLDTHQLLFLGRWVAGRADQPVAPLPAARPVRRAVPLPAQAAQSARQMLGPQARAQPASAALRVVRQAPVDSTIRSTIQAVRATRPRYRRLAPCLPYVGFSVPWHPILLLLACRDANRSTNLLQERVRYAVDAATACASPAEAPLPTKPIALIGLIIIACFG